MLEALAQALTHKPIEAAQGMTRFYQNGQPDAQPARVARFALYEVTSDLTQSVKRNRNGPAG